MTTQAFIQLIKNHPAKELRFAYGPNQYIPGYYHISEIKNGKLESVDCGGNTHAFNQTIVQLWLPDTDKDYEKFTGHKAGKIFDIVQHKTMLDPDAELLIEYGNRQLTTAHYAIGEICHEEHRITLHMYVPGPVCKPRLAWEEGVLNEKPCC